MESYQIKSELQDILDSDIQLRKEYSELKRSLSDYRNQLISRDEDCKRLQVTIDILNTKLVVMERDNTSYKSEITAFNELREGIMAIQAAGKAVRNGWSNPWPDFPTPDPKDIPFDMEA